MFIMEENYLMREIERSIRSNHFRINSKGTLYDEYNLTEVSILKLIPGDFSGGNYQFEGIAQIGIPNIDNDLLYHCYSIVCVAMINDKSILIVEPINIYKK